MTNVIEIGSKTNESESRSLLDALCLEGARTMLHRALEVEVAEYLERHDEARDEQGHALVTRHGKTRPRQVTIGGGTMTVEAPRVRDRRVDEGGERQRFTSAIFAP
jgi:putative transposase